MKEKLHEAVFLTRIRFALSNFRWMAILLVGLVLILWTYYSCGQRTNPTPGAISAQDISEIQPFHATNSRLTAADIDPADLSSNEAGSQPQASLRTSFFDFGDIGGNQPVSRDFYLENTGEGTLTIQQAYTTCMCTTADLSASVIPAGQASRITVTFDPRVHNVSGTTVRRGLILATNDPLHPTLEIWVQATVR